MRKILVNLGVLSFLFYLTACSSNAVEGNGKIAAATRTVPAFQAIHVSGAMHVVVSISDSQKVTVTTDSNLLNDIDTHVKNGTLYVQVKEGVSINPSTSINVAIDAKQLSAIRTAGSVNLSITQLQTNKFSVQSDGASQINLAGKVIDLLVKSKGSSQVEAVLLRADHATVSVDGAGAVKVFASKTLNITIKGAGMVKYVGDPEITQQVYGVGRILKVD